MVVPGVSVLSPSECPAGQIEYLGRGVAVADEVVDEEVVKHVRTDQILRFLPDLSGLVSRHEFRTDRSVGDVDQDFGGTTACIAWLVPEHIGRRPADKVLDQCLRYRGVHRVHRHVVAVVGAPPESQLGKVSRADHDAVLLIGGVHKDLCPFPGLRVLVGGVHHFRIVSDVLEMLLNCGHDGDLPAGHAKNLHQIHGVGSCAVGCAKAGHGDADDVLSRDSKLVERHDGHQKRQGAVESPGYSQNRFPAVDVFQARDKPGRLDLENLLGSLGDLGGISLREERMRLHVAVEFLGEVCRRRRTKVEA